MPTPATAGDTFTTESGRVFVVVDVNGTLVWREQVLQVGQNQLDFASGTNTASGRVLTLTETNQLTTALQGPLSRAGVIFSELVDQTVTPIMNPQSGFEYFLYDVSELLGNTSGTNYVIRALNNALSLENFIMGRDASQDAYYTFNF